MLDQPDVLASPNANHRDRSLLASVRRAIDDSCRNQRRDVLIDAAIVLLARRKSATTADLLQDLRSLFRTNAIPIALADQALKGAFAADLVSRVNSVSGGDQWTLTDAATRDVREDEQWATRIIDDFDSSARAQLDGDPDRDLIADHRLAPLAASVRQALAVGCQGLYEVQPASTPETVRPIAFNEHEAFKHLLSIEPKPVRHAAERLLVSALNPDDNFGDQYIHLLVAGNVLHAMATRRDLATKPDLTGARILLDTSAIVDLASPGTAEAQAIEETIRLSVALGAQVVVPDHVIAEWGALFAAADAEISDSAVTVERFGLIGVLADNTFLRAFNADSSGNLQLTWAAFRAKWQDPSSELKRLGVTLRRHFNESDVGDEAVVQELARELRILNRQRQDGGRKVRTADGVLADANSMAMVARWRRKSRPDAAFFIARDTMSTAAYAKARPGDEIPIAVTLPAWLVFVASLTVDNPDTKSELAQVIGNAALRSSFFGLSSCYTYREIVEFSQAMQQDDVEIDADDITAFVQHKLTGFERDVEISSSSPAKEGARVLSQRSVKRNQRARRAEDSRESDLRIAVDRERDAATVARRAQEVEHEGAVSDLTTTLSDVSGELARQRRSNQLLIRLVVSLAVSAGLLVTILVLWRSPEFDRVWKIRSALGGALWVLLSGWWVKEGSKNTIAFAVGGLVAPTLLSMLVEVG